MQLFRGAGPQLSQVYIRVITGKTFLRQLHSLAKNFDTEAKPEHGRYVKQPVVTDENGIVYIPPSQSEVKPAYILAGIAAVLVAGVIAAKIYKDYRAKIV